MQTSNIKKGNSFSRPGDQAQGLPSVGDMLADAKAGFDGAAYDAGWAARAKTSMW